MADGSARSGVIRRLVDTAWSADVTPAHRDDLLVQKFDFAWSADVAPADPDDALVRGFAEFGLPKFSQLATEDKLRELEAWRESLRIPANSAFLDITLLLTVQSLLGDHGRDVLTPATLWELTAFIDDLICFDRLYCAESPAIDVSYFNRRLGQDVLTAIPDPFYGMLHQVARDAARIAYREMDDLHRYGAGYDAAFDQEVQAVVDGWRAVLGPDFSSDGLFETYAVLHQADDPDKNPEVILTSPRYNDEMMAGAGTRTPEALLQLRVLVGATHLPLTPKAPTGRPPLSLRQEMATIATYRTYVDQGIANALALPYMPSTVRMPFRRLFVERAAEVQDELVTVALADQAFAQQQPSSPLTLPFFTTAVLQGATTRDDIWAQMARVRDQSAAFRRTRADRDRMLERSQVSPEALRVQSAIRDEALKLADLAGASQQSASVALGVVAQTGIVPLAGALKIGVDAAHGLSRGGSWTRIWRRLFHRHEYFLAQTNSQAIALTNALPQIQHLWEIPKIGGYLERFASATQQIGHVLRD
jgi:hypothetical protein